MVTRLALSLAIVSLFCGAEPAVDKTASAVINAYQSEDVARVYKALSPVVVRFKPDQLAKLDEQLTEAKLPSSGDILGEIRLKLIQLDQGARLPPPKGRERLLLLRYLHSKVIAFAEETRGKADDIRAGNGNKTPEGFENQLWDLHVLKNELLAASRLANYAVQLASTGGVAGLSDADRDFIKSFGKGEVYAPLQETERQMTELEMKLRLARLALGIQTLKNPKLTKERFMAAYSTAVDSETLINYLKVRAEAREKAEKAGDEDFPLHSTFDNPQTLIEVEEQQAEAKSLAGELAKKSRFFFEGLHWWLRARYGWGSEMGGLLKSEASVRDPQNSLWINMPRDLRITPTDPLSAAGGGTPQYERRFLYTWAWRDRNIERGELSNQHTVEMNSANRGGKVASGFT